MKDHDFMQGQRRRKQRKAETHSGKYKLMHKAMIVHMLVSMLLSRKKSVVFGP